MSTQFIPNEHKGVCCTPSVSVTWARQTSYSKHAWPTQKAINYSRTHGIHCPYSVAAENKERQRQAIARLNLWPRNNTFCWHKKRRGMLGGYSKGAQMHLSSKRLWRGVVR